MNSVFVLRALAARKLLQQRKSLRRCAADRAADHFTYASVGFERMRHMEGLGGSSEELVDLQHAALNSLQAGHQNHLQQFF